MRHPPHHRQRRQRYRRLRQHMTKQHCRARPSTWRQFGRPGCNSKHPARIRCRLELCSCVGIILLMILNSQGVVYILLGGCFGSAPPRIAMKIYAFQACFQGTKVMKICPKTTKSHSTFVLKSIEFRHLRKVGLCSPYNRKRLLFKVHTNRFRPDKC